MTRITMPPRKPVIPARESHIHICGHYDVCYPARKEQPCRKCRAAAFREGAVGELKIEIMVNKTSGDEVTHVLKAGSTE